MASSGSQQLRRPVDLQHVADLWARAATWQLMQLAQVCRALLCRQWQWQKRQRTMRYNSAWQVLQCSGRGTPLILQVEQRRSSSHETP